ncbi:MAG: hypothetical protein ACXADY_20970 [Candidatus Hodarchaeales archaeon]|jgi:hypothetical protein
MTNTYFTIGSRTYEEIRVIYTISLFNEIGVPQIREDIKNVINMSVDHVHLRLLPEMDIGLAIADEFEKGIIVFNRNGETTLDYTGMFVVEDDIGMEFLKDLWTYYWNISEPASLDK